MSLVVKEFPLEEEYKKHTGVTPADIARLREWLKTQPHLPEKHISDLDLILTYHCCDHSSEVSKQVLDLNLTLRTLFTAQFKDRRVDKRAISAAETVLMTPLQLRAHDGSAAILARLLDPEVKKFNFCDVIRLMFMVTDLWQYEEGTWPGFIILLDMAPVTLAHLTKLDIQTLQQLFCFLQEAMLVKLKEIHFMNAPSFMDKVMMIIKPFMKKKLLDAVHIHQVGSDTLEKHYPCKGLPKDVGGEGKSLAEYRDTVIEKLKANAAFFDNENQRRVTESLRPGKPKTITDVFSGTHGSFKTLDID